MSFNDDLKQEVADILRKVWSKRDGQKVPEPADLKLSNDAVLLDATILYADLSASTTLVDGYIATFAAEIYKSYLHAAAKIIAAEGGIITAYDGDRIMATYIGDGKDTSAVRTGLKINYAVQNIINPAIKTQYPKTAYAVRQSVGIDTSSVFVARTGIRGSNDLVWVGRAANYAAKLCGLSPDYPTWITDSVYDNLHDIAKYTNGKAMWEERVWTTMSNHRVYRSTWWWQV